MISIDAAVTELNAHRYNLDTGKFTVDHASFYARRAAKHDRMDPFTAARVFSRLMNGIMVPNDVPRLTGDARGQFDKGGVS